MSLPKPGRKREATRHPGSASAGKKPRLAISDGAGSAAAESAEITEVTEADPNVEDDGASDADSTGSRDDEAVASWIVDRLNQAEDAAGSTATKPAPKSGGSGNQKQLRFKPVQEQPGDSAASSSGSRMVFATRAAFFEFSLHGWRHGTGAT